MRLRLLAPAKRTERTAGLAVQANEPVLERELALIVATMVRTGSSDIGTMAGFTPRRAADRASPTTGSRRHAGGGCARCASRGPCRRGETRSRRRAAPSASITVQLSPCRPQPVSGLATPASVYITVSRSGEMLKPRCSKSSAVLTATVSASDGRTFARPSASLAPPTPPASARILPDMAGAYSASGGMRWLFGPRAFRSLMNQRIHMRDERELRKPRALWKP